MKRTLAKTLRSGLALVLAFCMTFGLCGTALATEVAAAENTIKYVSLGDSMTNGYGLSGYKYNGYLQDVPDSYPAKFAAHLKESGATVEHTPLAMSAMRAEDLHFILEFDYTDSEAKAVATMEKFNEARWNAKFSAGDYYTWDEFTTNNRFNNGAYNGEGFSPISTVKNYGAGVENVAKTYQEAVANADIISIGSGNANFGVFLLGRIMNAIGFDNGSAESDSWIKLENALRECDAETKAQAMKAYNDLKTRLSGAGLPADLVDPMVNAITYTIVSYMLNYAGAVERIVELNPDAEIMIVGLMNTMNGMEFTYGGQKYDLGQYMYGALSVVNAYLAGMVTAHQAAGKYPDATFYYAEASNVDVWVNNFASEIKVNNDIRKRFVIEIVGGENASDGKWEPGMVWPMMGTMVESMTETRFGQKLSLQNITLADVQNYEAALNKLAAGDTTDMASYTSNMGKALSCALYLAFEDAIVESSKVKNDATLSFDGLLALGKLDASLFSKVAEDFNNNIASAITEQKKPMVLAAATAQGTTIPEHDESVNVWNCEDENHLVCAELRTSLNTPDTTTDSLCTLLALPGTMSKALQSDEMIFGLLNMFARCLIGDGLGAHPSKAGHVDLTNAVIASYDGKHTAADQTKDNLIVVAEKLAELAAEYYDEAYAYAYAEAKNAGYIDQATAAIDDVIKALAAIDVSGTEMTDEFKAELAGEIEEIIETLTAAKALITEADVLDDAALTALMAMLDEGGEAIENLLNVIAQAGEDTNDLVVTPALKDAYTKLSAALKDAEAKLNTAITDISNKLEAAIKVGTDKLMEKLDVAYKAFVDAVTEAAKNVKDTAEQLPDWIYDYLYNNPEKVIAFFNEYGDDAVAFLNEYKEEALAVLGFVAYTYGEDMLQLALDNADEIIKHTVDLLDKHGENAWELIKVYLDELGIDLEEVAKDALAAAAEAVKDLVAQYAKEAYEYAYEYAEKNGYFTAVNDALEGLKDQLNEAAEWVEKNAKELGEELYNELKAQIEAAKEMITQIQNLVKNAKELGAETIAQIQQMLSQLGADLEYIADMLRDAGCELGEKIWSCFQNTVKSAVEKLEEAAKEGADWLVEKMGETYDAFVDAVVEAAKEYAPEVADWIYDYLYNNPAKVIAFLNEHGDDAVAFLNELKEEVMIVLGYVAANFGEDALEYVMDNADEVLKKTVEWLDKHGENAWKLIKVYLEELGLLENLPEIPEIGDIQDALDKITDVLDKFGPAVEDGLVDVTDKIIEELQNAVEELIDLIEAELKNATGEAKEKLEALYEAAKELKACIEKMIEDGVNAAIAEIQSAVKKLQDALKAAKDCITSEIQNKIDEIVDGVKDLLDVSEYLEEIQGYVEKLVDLIEAELKNATGEAKEKLEALYEAVKDLQDVIEQMIKDGTTALIDELVEAVSDVAKAAADAAAHLADKTVEAVENIVDAIKDIVNELYESATQDSYVITEDSYYVAIGDGTAVSESYVNQLAAELGVDYKNLAKEGMVVEDTYDVLKTNAADIAKADLITLGFGNNTFVNEVIDLVMADELPEIEWEPYVGKEGVPYVEDALAEIYNYFVESNISSPELAVLGIEDLPALLTAAVEAYAYNCVSYAANLPEVIEAIRSVNEDAVIVIVGMYNPLEDVTLRIGETEIELGEYVDYLVDAAGLHALVCSMVTGDSIYVAAPDVETSLKETELDVMDLIREYVRDHGANLNPSENGHEYIKDQILDSLTVYSGEIIDTGRTLSLEGVIYVNQYVKINGFENVDIEKNGGLLVWDHEVTEAEAVYGTQTDLNAGLTAAGDEYMQRTDGIAAAEYADDFYLRVYLELPDGTYVYGPLFVEYSVRYYCESVIDAWKNQTLAETCVAMLHFGTAAQKNFNYNVEDLANKNIVDKYPEAEWDASLINALDPVTTDIAVSDKVSDNGRTLSVDGAIVINAYYGFTGNVQDAELLVWDGVTGTVTTDNVSYSVDLTLVGKEWWAQTDMFPAATYGETIYLCGHFVDENGEDHYSEVVAFSPEEYARKVIEKNNNQKLVDLVQKMVTYGEFARIHFKK